MSPSFSLLGGTSGVGRVLFCSSASLELLCIYIRNNSSKAEEQQSTDIHTITNQLETPGTECRQVMNT